MFSENKAFRAAALISLFSLSACADHMNNRDSITLGAGNATEANMGIHTVDPFPATALDTTIYSSPEKVAQAHARYVEPCDPDVVTCGGSGDAESDDSVTKSE
ncbi:MAG: hypothetical protein NXI17_07305 [Alphaproteobacteria bacterium]|nr:hypothetical protein [Alphaproteobacteria bacterium]